MKRWGWMFSLNTIIAFWSFTPPTKTNTEPQKRDLEDLPFQRGDFQLPAVSFPGVSNSSPPWKGTGGSQLERIVFKNHPFFQGATCLTPWVHPKLNVRRYLRLQMWHHSGYLFIKLKNAGFAENCSPEGWQLKWNPSCCWDVLMRHGRTCFTSFSPRKHAPLPHAGCFRHLKKLLWNITTFCPTSVSVYPETYQRNTRNTLPIHTIPVTLHSPFPLLVLPHFEEWSLLHAVPGKIPSQWMFQQP